MLGKSLKFKNKQKYYTGVPLDIEFHQTLDVEPGLWSFLMDYCKSKTKKIKILDVGCATGRLLLGLIEEGYHDVHGVDYEKRMFEKTLQQYPRLDIKEGNAESLKGYKSNDFDVVVSYHVLEHLPNPELAIKATARVLKKNGAFLIGIPNGFHLDDVIRRFIQKLRYGRTDHLQTFSLEGLKLLLNKNGFTIKRYKPIYGSINCLLDKRWGFLHPLLVNVIFPICKKLYWKGIQWDILAIKSG